MIVTMIMMKLRLHCARKPNENMLHLRIFECKIEFQISPRILGFDLYKIILKLLLSLFYYYTLFVKCEKLCQYIFDFALKQKQKWTVWIQFDIFK